MNNSIKYGQLTSEEQVNTVFTDSCGGVGRWEVSEQEMVGGTVERHLKVFSMISRHLMVSSLISPAYVYVSHGVQDGEGKEKHSNVTEQMEK